LIALDLSADSASGQFRRFLLTRRIVRRARKATILFTAIGIMVYAAASFGEAPSKPSDRGEALFYLTDSPGSIQSFVAHADRIDLVAPNWYTVDGNGLISGGPNPLVLRTAKQAHTPVMPLVQALSKPDLHRLVTTEETWPPMISALVQQCKLHGYEGIQLDLEDISWTDRDALTRLVRQTALAFHQQHLLLTIATVPNAPGYAGQTGFGRWIWADWRGAYDLKALAGAVDFISLMTYDQHTRWTVPGPVAGWDWTRQNAEYALTLVPKEKISLGIALYGYHWYTGSPNLDSKGGSEAPNPTADYISAPDALQLATAYGGKVQWDPEDHSAWFYFNRDMMREWVFFTDARTFRERYDLARQYGFRGFSSWVLGDEDPAIWNFLPSHAPQSAPPAAAGR
jgi:spore germination protein YaaH